MNDIGKLIKERRLQLGLTLEDVGEKVGVGKSTVRKWEEGMIKSIRSDKLEALANVLQISPVDLITDKKPSFAKLTSDLVAKNVAFVETPDKRPEIRMLEKTRRLPSEVISVSEDPELKSLLKVWKVSTPAAKKSAIEILKVMNKTSKKE